MVTTDSEIIPTKVFIVVNGILFGLALFMAAVRIGIRVHMQRKLNPDDFVLMFACLTFIASQVLLYMMKPENVDWFGVELSPQSPALVFEDLEAVYRQVLKTQRMVYSIGILIWTSIFAVKISFLLFFHQMVIRFRRLIVAWRVILGITIIFWALCSCGYFISCSHFGQAMFSCTQSRGYTRNIAVSIMGVVLDISSDLLLISLPLVLLWKVKMKRRQKISLGVFLCLSVCMIITAIVRVLGVSNNSNFTWGLFWLQAEAATAIIMVSITAFRSLLGLKAQKARKEKEMERSWFAHRPKLLARHFKKVTEDESESEQLPSSGIRPFIDGNEIWDGVNGIGKIHQLE